MEHHDAGDAFHLFAYGSLMQRADLERTVGPVDDGALVGAAWLPMHKLRFDVFSRSRGCGAANVSPAVHYSVPGTLWRLPVSALPALDAREAHPHVYVRDELDVWDETAPGGERSAVVYRAPGRRGLHVPDDEYLGLMREGYAAVDHRGHSLSEALELARLWASGSVRHHLGE